MKYLRFWLWAYCLLMLSMLPLILCSIVIAKTLMLFTMAPITFTLLLVALAGVVAAAYAPVMVYCIVKYVKPFDILDWS